MTSPSDVGGEGECVLFFEWNSPDHSTSAAGAWCDPSPMSTIEDVDEKLAQYIANVATVVAASIREEATVEHSRAAAESRLAFRDALQKYVEPQLKTE